MKKIEGNWCVPRSKEHPRWEEFLKYLRAVSPIKTISGNAYNYYGVVNNEVMWGETPLRGSSVDFLYLNQFFERYDAINKQEEFPEKWCIKPDISPEQSVAVRDWFNAQREEPYKDGYEYNYYWHYPHYANTTGTKDFCLNTKKTDYTEISFEQFQQYISMSRETQPISREGLKEIYTIACASWKIKILDIAKRFPFADIALSQKQVTEMFVAANFEQKIVLRKYLTEPVDNRNAIKSNITESAVVGVSNYLFNNGTTLSLFNDPVEGPLLLLDKEYSLVTTSAPNGQVKIKIEKNEPF